MRKEHRRLCAAQKQEIFAKYNNGVKKADLAREYDVHFNTVVNAIVELSAGQNYREKPGRRKALTDPQREWAFEQWCNGYTQAEIAEALFVSPVTINNELKGRKRVKKPLYYDFEKEGVTI